jgi:hypothetical protein
VPRARPWLTRRAVRARAGPRLTVHRARAYKATQTRNTPLCTLPDFADLALSSGELYSARPSHPSTGHRDQPFPQTTSLTRAPG